MHRLIPIALLFLILLSSGCLQGIPPDKRLLCLDLTERSYAFVPECSTQAECFSQLEKRLFNFDPGFFSPTVQSELYSYKNNVAQSWFYFNKARSNISEIHAACSYEKDFSILPVQLNELTHNLHKAFEFSDIANKASFTILLLESHSLGEEDINAIREEPLFNDHIAINHNLRFLSSPQSCQGKTSSYACLYLHEADAFAQLTASTGFSTRLLQEATVFDLLEGHNKEIKDYADSAFKLPVLTNLLPSFLSYLGNYFKLLDALDNLESFPSFQFLQQYNQFMGSRNSCLQGFSEIMKADALHRAELQQRNSELISQINTGINAAQQSANALLSKQYASFDANFFQELYAGLGQGSTIRAQQYSISDFTELNRKAEQELSEIQSKLLQIQQLDSLSLISLGEKTQALKGLNHSVHLLQDNIDFLQGEVVQGLLVLCSERASSISSGLENTALPAKHLLLAADLRARAKFKLALFNDAASEEQKLFQCRELLDEFSRFKTALTSFQQYELQEQALLGECFSFLGTVFSSPQQLSLADFSLRYHQLQSLERPYDDLAAVERLCRSLQSDVSLFLQQHQTVQSIESNFAESTRLMEALRLVNARDNSTLSDSSLQNLEEQLQHFQGFFSGNSMLPEKSLPVLNELEQGLFDFTAALQEAASNAIASFAENNAQISIEQSPSNPATELVSVTLANPFQEIAQPLTLEIPFTKPVGSTLFSTLNIAGLRSDGKNLLIDLNSLPKGQTTLGFSTDNVVEVTGSTALLSASNAIASFKKTIEIQCSSLLPKVQVNTLLLDAPSLVFENISVSSNGARIQFLQQGNSISFSLEDCLGEQTAEVLFSVPSPIILTTRFLEQTEQEETTLFTYSIEAENRLPFELKSPEINLPIPFSEKDTKGIELLDSMGKKLKFSLLPAQKLAFSLPNLPPGQPGPPLFLRVAVPSGSEQNTALLQENPAPNPDPGIEEAVHATSQKISGFSSTISEAEQKLSTLETLFSSVQEREIIAAKYLPPISEEELNRLKLKLNSLKAALSQQAVQDFISLQEQGSFEQALSKSKRFEPLLEEKQQQANAINSQLSNALAALKEDALASYNSAAAVFNSSPGSQEAEQKLQQAKQALQEGSFLQAITHSRNATALLSAPPPGGGSLNFPLLLLPLAAAVALVLIVRRKKETFQKQRKEQVKRIARNW